MIRFLIYIFVIYLLFKKMYTVVNNYKEYYSINKLKLNLVKANNETKENKGLMLEKIH